MSRTEFDSHHAARGFALLEIAMVLVVVALLLAGVGRVSSAVTQARVKSLDADAKAIAGAIDAYQSRYAALPGDDPSAATRWAEADAKGGNGDGLLSGSYDATPPADPRTLRVDGERGESLAFWGHLRLAGLIDGSTTGAVALSQPWHADGGILGVQSGALGLAGIALCYANVGARYAEALDRQLDDGRPATGVVRAGAAVARATTLGSPATEYQDDGERRYVVCVSMQDRVHVRDEIAQAQAAGARR